MEDRNETIEERRLRATIKLLEELQSPGEGGRSDDFFDNL
jgi:hypothetical protein